MASIGGSSSIRTAALLLAVAAGSASAQESKRDSRSFVAPPPSATSTGGAPVPASPTLHSAPRLRGKQLETRDAMHPDEIELVGLEQSGKPYRADLELDRSALGENRIVDASGENADLHRRQLAVYSGEVAKRLPEVARRHGSDADPAADGSDAARGPTSQWFGLAVAGLIAALLAIRNRLRRGE